MEHPSSPAPRTALPGPYFSAGTSSFVDLLAEVRPDLLPGAGARRVATPATDVLATVPHGTTIVAATFTGGSGGVVIAGDRRATMGNLIAQRDIEKVFVTDDFTAAGIAGTAGIAVEAVRLFTVELQHYEKLEGVPLTFDGKANKLAAMIRGNLGAAMQGLSFVPLFAGYDLDAADPARGGRIVSYDVVGGKSEEVDYSAVGSGSLFAKSALKKRHDPTGDADATVRSVLEALYDAADDDSATGGPDLTRGIFPVVMLATAAGIERVPDDELDAVVRALLADREAHPGS